MFRKHNTYFNAKFRLRKNYRNFTILETIAGWDGFQNCTNLTRVPILFLRFHGVWPGPITQCETSGCHKVRINKFALFGIRTFLRSLTYTWRRCFSMEFAHGRAGRAPCGGGPASWQSSAASCPSSYTRRRRCTSARSSCTQSCRRSVELMHRAREVAASGHCERLHQVAERGVSHFKTAVEMFLPAVERCLDPLLRCLTDSRENG